MLFNIYKQYILCKGNQGSDKIWKLFVVCGLSIIRTRLYNKFLFNFEKNCCYLLQCGWAILHVQVLHVLSSFWWHCYILLQLFWYLCNITWSCFFICHEHRFMCLFKIYISYSFQCWLTSFAQFLIGVFIFFCLMLRVIHNI